MTQLTVMRQTCTISEAEVYLLMFIKPVTKLPPLARRRLSDIDLWATYRSTDSVATGRVPSLFCDITLYIGWGKDGHVDGFYMRSFECKKFHSE